ncbi:MAG: hypothetical protein WC809_19795 [Sinimarinibacterium sp.]
MNDVERAISQIEDIRAQLAASTRFRGIAPKGSALTGVFACVVAIAQTLWPDTLAQDHLRYVAVWAVFTVASVTIVAIEAISISRALHGPIADTLLGAVSRQVLPFGGAGAVITFAICRFSPDAAWMLPGIWQILIALVGFSAQPNLPRNVVWPARWYFLSGSVVLGLAGSSGTLSPWMMGLPLAIGQFVVVLILRDSGERDGRA